MHRKYGERSAARPPAALPYLDLDANVPYRRMLAKTGGLAADGAEVTASHAAVERARRSAAWSGPGGNAVDRGALR